MTVSPPAFYLHTCARASPPYLLSLLRLRLLSEVGSLQNIPHYCQAFPCLQLGGEGDQARVFDCLI